MKLSKPLRILDFDIECRPIAWYGGDMVTKQPTAIAWKWVGSTGEPFCVSLSNENDVLEEERAMLAAFVEVYDQADMVTGHYIRGFDLPVINGALARLGMAPLKDKLTSDTKLDLLKMSGVSKSMENLSAMFEAKTQKFSMNTTSWAKANMLIPEGIELARRRVMQDVDEHIELRSVLIEHGLLGKAKVWTGTPSASMKYAA